jgi:hypothetical protein
MSGWVELSSRQARRAFIAGPFPTLDDARAWAAHWRAPRDELGDELGDEAEASKRQIEAEAAGAIPPTDWTARVSEDPVQW